MKRGILLAAFGSSNPGAHRTLDRFDRKVRETFPGVPIRWAFTSGFIRRKLAGEGMKTDSVSKALHKMVFEKFSHVVAQSLHVIPGAEFNELLVDAQGFQQDEHSKDHAAASFERILVGDPLLANAHDAERAALAVLRHLPPERAPQDAVVLMGHGTWHHGKSMYDVLAEALRRLDPLIRIGVMEDPEAIRTIAAALPAENVSKVWLLPLLAVAGAHVRHDMAGDHPDSWKSILLHAGLDCRPVIASAAEYDGFATIWIDHLRDAMAKLDAASATTLE